MSGIVPWGRGYVGAYTPPYSPIAAYRQEVNPSVVASQTSLRDWWRELQGEPPSVPAQTPMEAAMAGIRHNGEAAIVAALLALIDTDLGGLDMAGRLPLDWVGAAIFYGLSVKEASKPGGWSADYRAASQSCTSVATYRTMHRWREEAKAIPRNTSPISSGDPVLAAGKSAGF